MAETQIKDLTNAGSSRTDMHFAVQQDSAEDIGQEITLAEFSVSTEITGLDVTDTTRLMTPNSFRLTTATTSRVGTVELAEDAEILGKSVTKALVAANVDKIFEAALLPTKIIEDSDIDGNTDGTIVIGNLKQRVAGEESMINGGFAFTPNITNESVEIIINNVTPPAFIQGGTCTYYTTDANRRISAGVSIEGTGAAQMTVTVGKTESGQDFNSGVVHNMTLTLNYFI